MKFSLSWKDYQTNATQTVHDLWNDQDFSDVTLACEDKQIKAHKLIVSSSSPIIRNILNFYHLSPIYDIILNPKYFGEYNNYQYSTNIKS